MLNVEFAILDFIQKYISSPFMDKIMCFITSLGNGGVIWIVLSLYLLFSKKYRTTGIMMAVGLILSLLLGNMILKPLVGRLRPFQLREGIELLITPPGDYSFPSGHTLSSFVSAFVLILRERRKGYTALIIASLIAFSRMYLYVHFPTDILAGIVLGITLAIASVKIVNGYKTKKLPY